MNPSIKDASHPSFIYYDSDYPSKNFSTFPENFDSVVREQGIEDDVDKYQELCRKYGETVLELCCGTGRVAIPLAMDGCHVTAVDISPSLLNQLKNKIRGIDSFPKDNLTILRQDVSHLALPAYKFDVVICAFNSLLCIPDFEMQQKTLFNAARLLKPGGVVALDIWNPLATNLLGDEIPEFYFTRIRVDNGNTYSRYSATGPMDISQVQPLYGWYDETDAKGITMRTPYHLEWRLIFLSELGLMLEKAGLKIDKVTGGNNGEPLLRSSIKMFVEASLI
jgi:ubiquinone/menaquinone biosynthesis C-methylase UbiE